MLGDAPLDTRGVWFLGQGNHTIPYKTFPSDGVIDVPGVAPGLYWFQLVFADGSIDAVYTNVLDHAFDLGKVVSEVQRVLRPGGLFVADLAYGTEEGAIGGEYEAFWWNDSNAMINQLAVMGNFDLVESRELPSVRSARWRQGVMRKPSNQVTGVAWNARNVG